MMILGKDINGNVNYSLPFSEIKKQTSLIANIEQHFTVPLNYDYYDAIFSFEPGSTVWVSYNSTAEIPTGSFYDNLSELNPAVRRVKGGALLSFITPNDSAQIGVILYAVKQQ